MSDNPNLMQATKPADPVNADLSLTGELNLEKEISTETHAPSAPITIQAPGTVQADSAELQTALATLATTKTQTEEAQKFFKDDYKQLTKFPKESREALAAFALNQYMDQQSMDKILADAAAEVEKVKPKKKEAARKDYLSKVQKAIALYKENGDIIAFMKKECETPAFAPVLERAASFRVRPWDEFEKTADKLLEKNVMRNYVFRAILSTMCYAEHHRFDGGTWEEGYRHDLLVRRELVESNAMSQETFKKEMAWDNPYRFELPPSCFAPKNEEERYGVYKEQYDRMDFSLLKTQAAFNYLGQAKTSDDPNVRAFSADLEKVLLAFHNVFFQISDQAEARTTQKDYDEKTRDGIMDKLASLSYRYGIVAQQAMGAAARFISQTRENKISPEEATKAVNAFSVMAQHFQKQVPSVRELTSGQYKYTVALRTGNEFIDSASGIFQYASFLATSKAEHKQILDEHHSASNSFFDEHSAIFNRGIGRGGANFLRADGTAGGYGRIAERRALLSTEEGRRQAEEERKRDDRVFDSLRREKKKTPIDPEHHERDSGGLLREVEDEVLETLEDQVREENTEQVVQTKISYLKQNTQKLELKIPSGRIEKLDSYSDGKEKYLGVRKTRAFFVRHGFISGGKLREAMERHTNRFLRGDEVTDENASLAADALSSSCGLFDKEMKAHWGGIAVIADKLNAVEQLNNAHTAEEVSAALETVKTKMGLFDSDEPDADSQYFKEYPYAAKIIFMDKLLHEVQGDTLSHYANGTRKQKKLASEYETRLEALRESVSLLSEAVRSSAEYRKAKADHISVTTTIESSPQIDQMYRGRPGELVNGQTQAASYVVDPLTIIGAHKRKEESIDVSIVVQQDKARFNEMSRDYTVGRMRIMYESLDKTLLGMSKEREKTRLMLLAQKGPELPEYKLKAGSSAREILRDTIRSQISQADYDAEIKELLNADFDVLYAQTEKQLVKDGPAGAKSLDDLNELTIDHITGYALSVVSRIKVLIDILGSNETYKKDVEFRRSLFEDVLAGKVDTLTKQALDIRYFNHLDKQEILKSKQEVLTLGKSLQEPRVFFDVTKLGASETLANLGSFITQKVQVRSIGRYKRMTDIDKLLEALRTDSGIEPPEDFYTYASRELDKQKAAAKSTPESGPTDGTTPAIPDAVSKADTAQARALYTAHLQRWEQRARKKIEKVTDEDTRAIMTQNLDVVMQALTQAYSGVPEYVYAGVASLQSDLTVALGTSVDADDRETFEENMQATMLRYATRLRKVRHFCKKQSFSFTPEFEANIRRTVLSNLAEEDMLELVRKTIEASKSPLIQVAVQNKDTRISSFYSMSNGAFRPLFPILLEDRTFSDKLVGGSEAEWKNYLDPIIKRCVEVTAELTKHPYFEQYLIGKKKDIHDLILENTTDNVEQTLALEAYDKQIEGHRIGTTNLKKILQSKLRKAKDAKLGNVVMSVLMIDGVSAILDDSVLSGYVARVEDNTVKLTNEIFGALQRQRNAAGGAQAGVITNIEDLTPKEKAVFVSILHNERCNLIRVDTAQYDAHKQVTDWFGQIEKANNDMKDVLRDLDEIKTNMAPLIDRKEKGRKAFIEYRKKTRIDRNGTLSSDKKFLTLPEDQRKLITKILSEKDKLPADGSLNDLYSQTITRVAAHTSIRDPEEALGSMTHDYAIFLNAKTFRDTVTAYLSGKDYLEDRKQSLLRGLFDFYGQEITDGTYLLTAEQIKESLDSFFNNEKVRNEFVRFVCDSTGGYAGFSSEQTETERTSFLGMTTREQFEDSVKDFRQFREYFTLSPEERVLCGQLIAIDGALAEPMSFLERTLRVQGSVSAQKNDLIYSYLTGAPIQAANYRTVDRILYCDGKFRTEYLKSAIAVVKQVREMKNSRSFILTDAECKQLMSEEIHEEEYAKDTVISAMSDLLVTVETRQDELKRDKYTPNSERLFEYFTALRPFVSQMRAFLKDEQAGGNAELRKKVQECYDDYVMLEGYTRLLTQRNDPNADLNKLETEKHTIEEHFGLKLKTYTGKATNDRREAFYSFMDEHLYATDRITRETVATRDRTEEDYPPATVEAVKAIDRWIAMHAANTAESDTENIFGSQILSHPISERLFVYYVVEKDRLADANTFDAVLSQAYVPNLDAFVSQMTKAWWHVGSHIATALKSTDFVKDHTLFSAMLANTGSLCFDKLEGAIHLLDDHDTEFAEHVADASHMLIAKDDPTLPMPLRESLRDRNNKYLYLHDQIIKLEEMSKDLKADDPKLLKQEKAMRDALILVTDADAVYGEQVTRLMNFLKSGKLEDKANAAQAAEERKDGARDLLISFPGTVASLAETLRDSAPPFWKLKDLKDLVSSKPAGFFTGIQAVSAISQAVVAAVVLAEDSENMTATARARAGLELLDNATSVVETVGAVAGDLLGSSVQEGAEAFASGFGSIVQVVNGVSGAVLDLTSKVRLRFARYRTGRQTRQMLRHADSQHEATHVNELQRDSQNVERAFQRSLSADLRDDAISTIGGLSKLLLRGGIGEAIDKVTSAVSTITGFFRSGKEKTALIDDFIGTDVLLAKYNKLCEEGSMAYYDLRTDDDKKEFIRKEALKRLHAPSFDVFFTDLAARYARVLHNHIFARANGTPILSSDTEEIAQRESFCALFPETTFKYPDTADQAGSPTTADLAKLIMNA